MDDVIATCVQQQVRIFENHGEFRNDVQRFMRLAKVKESHLVVFPELSGLLLVPPLAPGLKRTLLRVAERQVRRKSSLFDRMVGRAADSAADAMGGIGKSLVDAIIEHENTLRDAYLTTFSEIAREYNMHIVGGSIYLPDSRDGQLHNTAYLFSPTGEVIGQQSKVNLSEQDKLFCQPGIDGLKSLDTDFGKLSILIGQDTLYPESGRILADGGTLLVVGLLLSTGPGAFWRARQAFSARLQENLFLGAQSCMVGKNILGQSDGDYTGKSAILAPLELTTRHSGVLGEVGTMVGESIVSATWDLKGLYELRNTADESSYLVPDDDTLRRQLQKLYGDAGDVEEQAPPAIALPSPTVEEWPLPVLSETSSLDEQPSTEGDTESSASIPEEASEAILPIEAVEIIEEETGTELPQDEEIEDYFNPLSETTEQDPFAVSPLVSVDIEQTVESDTVGQDFAKSGLQWEGSAEEEEEEDAVPDTGPSSSVAEADEWAELTSGVVDEPAAEL
jgi:predicted amidohydrolase